LDAFRAGRIAGDLHWQTFFEEQGDSKLDGELFQSLQEVLHIAQKYEIIK